VPAQFSLAGRVWGDRAAARWFAEEPVEDEEKVLAGHPGANMPALLTKDARRLNHVPLRRSHRGFRQAMVRALPAAIKRSISLPKASDDTDESLSLAAAGFGHLAVAAVVRDIAAHPLAAAAGGHEHPH
jgi:hypothetical protein